MKTVSRKHQKPPTRQRWPVPMDVKPSHIEEHGLFTAVPLRTRLKIGEFTGERISQREGRRRAKTQKCIAIVALNQQLAIEATNETSGFRFINHSCSPNTFIRIIRERAEFYALYPIKADTKMTVDCYPSHNNGTLPCQCQSAACRGRL